MSLIFKHQDVAFSLSVSAIENKEEVLQVPLSLDDLKLKRRQMNFLMYHL